LGACAFLPGSLWDNYVVSKGETTINIKKRNGEDTFGLGLMNDFHKYFVPLCASTILAIYSYKHSQSISTAMTVGLGSFGGFIIGEEYNKTRRYNKELSENEEEVNFFLGRIEKRLANGEVIKGEKIEKDVLTYVNWLHESNKPMTPYAEVEEKIQEIKNRTDEIRKDKARYIDRFLGDQEIEVKSFYFDQEGRVVTVENDSKSPYSNQVKFVLYDTEILISESYYGESQEPASSQQILYSNIEQRVPFTGPEQMVEIMDKDLERTFVLTKYKDTNKLPRNSIQPRTPGLEEVTYQ
jgi:hypothetical protein